MSSPERKRKKKKKKTTDKPFLPLSTANLSLPDDLLLDCIARLSRLYYPTLSLVSKSYRSLLASPELYKTRSFLSRTESCLYVCLRFPPDPNPRWFTLCRRPNPTLTKKKKLREHLLVPITTPHSTPVLSSLVAVGSDIYEIGGLINDVPSSSVSILDCRSNTWHKAPNMELARWHPYATAIDGKILVKEDPNVYNSDKRVEVFDPKTQTWNIVSHGETGMERQSSSSCVIDDVWYSYEYGGLCWFDTMVNYWRRMKGLEGLPKSLFSRQTSCSVHLADYGGKMAFLWHWNYRSSKCQERMISCAVVALERCSSEEISGTVEWSGAVLKVPKSFEFLHVLAATV